MVSAEIIMAKPLSDLDIYIYLAVENWLLTEGIDNTHRVQTSCLKIDGVFPGKERF